MATIKSFEELHVWQKARALCDCIFTYINREPFKKDFKLVNQINASSCSVMDNIAEGFGRGSKNEFIQFLSYSRGSCNEVKSQLYKALDRKYITKQEFDHCYDLADYISRANKKFIEYLNQCLIKGEKFKDRDLKK